MPGVPRSNDPRGGLRPGAIGGDPASAMGRPAFATVVPGVSQRTQVVATGATSGGFQLQLVGRGGDINVTTAVINWNDPLATVVNKINAALPAGVSVTGISGGPLPAAVVFEFTSEEAHAVTAVNSTLVGGAAAVTTPVPATGAVVSMPNADPSEDRRVSRNARSSDMARPEGLGR